MLLLSIVTEETAAFFNFLDKKLRIFMSFSNVIGHGGEEIEKLKKQINKLVGEEVQISIMEVKNPDMDAQLVANNIDLYKSIL